MNGLRLLWHDYHYFPYEMVLAEREARLLFGTDIAESQEGFFVEGKKVSQVLTFPDSRTSKRHKMAWHS